MLPGYTEHSLGRAAALLFWSFICLKKSYEIWVGSAGVGAGGVPGVSERRNITPHRRHWNQTRDVSNISCRRSERIDIKLRKKVRASPPLTGGVNQQIKRRR